MQANYRPVRIWLAIIALLIVATAVVGAATRLTGSGLSITEWNPIMGVLPPLSDADWQAAFAKYREIPQYAKLNKGMSLAAFQMIFWWEWSHRLLARSIGAVFFLPFLVFLAKGMLPRRLAPRLAAIFLLGGLQGFVGWYMVKSGLVDRVDVSPIRLALHLGMATLVLALVVWTWADLAPPRPGVRLSTLTRGQRLSAWLLLALVYVQVLLGAIVAGLKAGRTYNTWPLMDGQIIPDGLWTMTPGWLNIFDNAGLVQLNHRMMAYVVVLLALFHAVSLLRTADDERVRRSATLVAIALLAQMALGIWTLLAWVPIHLGVAHQLGALVVLMLTVWHTFAMHRATRT